MQGLIDRAKAKSPLVQDVAAKLREHDADAASRADDDSEHAYAERVEATLAMAELMASAFEEVTENIRDELAAKERSQTSNPGQRSKAKNAPAKKGAPKKNASKKSHRPK